MKVPGNGKMRFRRLFCTVILVMDGIKILKHVKGAVFILGTKPNSKKSAVAVKRVLKHFKPHVVAVELCLTKLEEYAEMRKGARHHDISIDLIPNRLKHKARGERALLEMVRDAIVHGDACRPKREARVSLVGLNFSSANLYHIEPKVFRNEEIDKEIRVLFRDNTWQLDFHSLRYLISDKTSYKVMLAGKPYEDTACAIADAMTDEEKNIIFVYARNFTKLFISNSSTHTIMTDILRRNVKLKNVIINQRNEYLAGSLLEAMNAAIKYPGPKRVLAVVRNSRVNGIIEHWNRKVQEEQLAKERR